MIGEVCTSGRGIQFAQASNWITPDYTIVSASNRFVMYADCKKQQNRYDLTIFKFEKKTFPLRRFESLPEPIVIVDKRMCPRTLVRYDPESGLYLEEGRNGKIRLYRNTEVIDEDS